MILTKLDFFEDSRLRKNSYIHKENLLKKLHKNVLLQKYNIFVRTHIQCSALLLQLDGNFSVLS